MDMPRHASVAPDPVTQSEGRSDRTTHESAVSAVSWAAILAGAFVAAAVSLVLALLGSGLGLAALGIEAGAGAAKVSTSIWFLVVQWASAAAAGYLTGRLRTKWVGTHTHEVFFRDTAHGFVSWAVATLAVAALVGSSAASLIGVPVRAAANAGASSDLAYEVDSLLRSPAESSSPAETRAEALRIFARGAQTGEISDADRDYLARELARRSGTSAGDARGKVDAAIERMRSGLEAARKGAATAAILSAVSLLIGAFIACVAAALGGRERDQHP